jgi:purine-binding chemotaxis protein CheW
MSDSANAVSAELSALDGDEDAQAGKFLTFIIGDVTYGLDIRSITEIIGLQKITIIPDVPAYIKGVINLRGKVIPVMDVRTRFQLPRREYDERTCIIVIDVEESTVGLVVDTVSEVLDIDDDSIEPPPNMGSNTASRYISGMGKVGNDVKVLLEAQRLLLTSEMSKLTGEKAPDA